MRLFSKIYTFLLIGLVAILVIEGNIHYEWAIRQFDRNMMEQAETTGRIIAGMVARVWLEAGADQAWACIADASRAEPRMTFSWLWFDEATSVWARANQPTPALVPWGTATSFIAIDDQHRQRRFTLVATEVPGDRQGGLLISQSMQPLADYSRKMLIRTLLITVLLALTSALIIYLFIYFKIHQPLEQLSRKAIEIGRGNLAADLDLKGENELVSLARAMNDMCTRLLIAKEKIHFEYLARLKTLEQLRHTEKLSTIGQISAGIAHEMGTPLNVVDGRAKMIISEALEKAEIVRCAEIIRNQAEKMTRIIRQLLDFSRKKKAGPKTRENLAELVHQVFQLLRPIAARQQIDLHMRSAPDSRLHSRVDAQQIQQVLMNVILNGIQASPVGSHVLVELTNTMLKSMIHTDDQLREYIRIEVLDEGSGIPEHLFAEVFTPFYTTKQIGLGTGLGLSISRELLEEHGGWIEVKNRSVQGAHFSIFLPPEETGQ
jgi:two-component system, NtrC family, sensor kinase